MTQKLAQTIEKFKIPLLPTLNSHFLKPWNHFPGVQRWNKSWKKAHCESVWIWLKHWSVTILPFLAINSLCIRLWFYVHLCILRSWVSRCRPPMVFWTDLDKALVSHHPYFELSNSMFLWWLFLLSCACVSSCLARFWKPVQILPHLFSCKIRKNSIREGFCSLAVSKLWPKSKCGFKISDSQYTQVGNVCPGWPIYDVKCLCSRGWKWGREGSLSH